MLDYLLGRFLVGLIWLMSDPGAIIAGTILCAGCLGFLYMVKDKK